MRLSGILYVGLQSVRKRPIRAVVMIAAISLLVMLPMVVTILVSHYTDTLTLRAQSSPRFLCHAGSRYDRIMETLFFDQPSGKTVPFREVSRLNSGDLAIAVPLLVAGTVSGQPLVAVSSDYYEMRSLVPDIGRLPIRLGEAVLGAEAAQEMALSVGDKLVTDGVNPLDIAGRYPVQLIVTGVLEERGSADDQAVFCSVQTGWLSIGLAHGHQELGAESDSAPILIRETDNLVGSPIVTSYIEVNDENRNSFHFHGNMDDFPLTALFLWTDSPRSNIILSSRYRGEDDLEVLNPVSVARELNQMIFDLKKIVDLVLTVTGAAAAALVVLVFLLSLQLRSVEFDSLYRLGASKLSLIAIASFDLVFYLICSFTIIVPVLVLTGIFAGQLMRIGL